MTYTCSECNEKIKKKEYTFSMQNYSKSLCRTHQEPYEPEGGKLYTNKKMLSTKEAKKIANLLVEKGWKVTLEKWDGKKHIDIAIFKAKVDIEVDGPLHNQSPKQAIADLKRTYHSLKKGWLTLRIPNCLVDNEETIEYIDLILKERLNSSNNNL